MYRSWPQNDKGVISQWDGSEVAFVLTCRGGHYTAEWVRPVRLGALQSGAQKSKIVFKPNSDSLWKRVIFKIIWGLTKHREYYFSKIFFLNFCTELYVASKALKLWSLSYLYKTGLSVQFSAQCQIYSQSTNSYRDWHRDSKNRGGIPVIQTLARVTAHLWSGHIMQDLSILDTPHNESKEMNWLQWGACIW